MRTLAVILSMTLLSAAPAWAPAGDAPKSTPKSDARASDAKKTYLEVNDQLTRDDPADEKVKGSYHKVHPIELEAGKTYRIDMTSAKIYPLLRFVDPDGKEVDDVDGGGTYNARVVHTAKRAGTYKILATAVPEPPRVDVTGPYHLTVRDAEPRDLVIANLQNALSSPSAKELAAAIGATTDMLSKEKSVSPADADLALELAYILDRVPKADGVKYAGELKTFLARSDDVRIRAASGVFDGVGRRLDLPGNPMELKGTKLDGEAFDWKPYQGKVVLVDFWATWCPPCRAAMPHLKKLRDKFGEAGFDVIGISADREDDAPAAFMKKNGYDWTCIYEKDKQGQQPMVERYGIFAFPTTILIGRDGKVAELNPSFDRLDELVERLVEKKSP
jgi:thiol-disulfide isomerase/thioredoxin